MVWTHSVGCVRITEHALPLAAAPCCLGLAYLSTNGNGMVRRFLASVPLLAGEGPCVAFSNLFCAQPLPSRCCLRFRLSQHEAKHPLLGPPEVTWPSPLLLAPPVCAYPHPLTWPPLESSLTTPLDIFASCTGDIRMQRGNATFGDLGTSLVPSRASTLWSGWVPCSALCASTQHNGMIVPVSSGHSPWQPCEVEMNTCALFFQC